ncbi:MAG: acyl-CoA dehydrogenase [Gammaproteobacteria bacterium]|nr:MAG: acyl-CoA dehydrogenase [Gammaproteobacteria bacterium]
MAALTEEQSLIKDQAETWVAKEAPVQSFRNMRDSDNALSFDDATWSNIVEMGWTGILVPEQYGGSELGYLTFGIVLEEIGKHLVASPLFASAFVGASAILLGGSDQQKQALLPGIVSGDSIMTLALEESPRHAPEKTALKAESSGSGFSLSGTKTFVLEGMSATSFIVAARTSGNPGESSGITLFVVPADTPGLSRSKLETLDSRGYANLNFDNVEVSEASVLGQVGEGFGILTATLDRARAGIGAEMLGTGSQAFELTLEYLKTRVQFGKVIGSFQALGHRAAGFFTQKELARSCVEAALQAIDADAKNVDEMSTLSKCKVGDFLHDMSNELIQIHGGIGMTDQLDAGFYLKRARVLETAYGNQAYHRSRYAELMGF